MEEVVGFTQKQRDWFINRDGGQCTFHFAKVGIWIRCKNRSHLEVHHRIPRGWALMHLPKDFPVNGATNGVTLCSGHHNGYRANGDYRFVVHSDTEEARLRYRQDKESYRKMGLARRQKNEVGQPYWNTNYDWMFERWILKHNVRFLRLFPYPDNGHRGVNGRLK